MFYDQGDFAARFEWGIEAVRRLAPVSDVVVIVDVLSFGTAVDVAVARGAAVVPYPRRGASAVAHAQTIGAELAVDRSQVGPDHPYSLSPASLLNIRAGTRLVLTSPNGSTLAAIAAEAQAAVLAGCLRNARAVARAARTLGRTVTVVAAGERWEGDRGGLRPAVEDLVGAGAILAGLGIEPASPEARAAVGAFQAAARDLPRFLSACASGRELRELGFTQDVELAAQLDVSDAAPLLTAGSFAAWSA